MSYRVGVIGILGLIGSLAVSAETLRMSQAEIIGMVIEQNDSIQRDRLEKDIVSQSIGSAQSVFDPVLFGNARYTNENTEKSSTSFSLNPDPVRQSTFTAEGGVRQLMPTGGELSVGLSVTEIDSSEVESYSPNNAYSTESRADLSITLRQPLLQGFQAVSAYEGIKEASANAQIREFDLQARVLRTVGEGLRQYWGVYRAEQALKLNRRALFNAMTLVSKAEALVDAGKRSQIDLIEAEALVLGRRADVAAAQAQVRSSKADLLVTLGLPPEHDIRVNSQPLTQPPPVIEDVQAYAQQVLADWPGYKKALTQLEIEDSRIIRAQDGMRPQLDLLFGHTSKGLDSDRRGGLEDLKNEYFREWYVGFTFEMPLGGNRRANAIAAAAETRKLQAELDSATISRRLTADIEQRLVEAEQAYTEWQLAEDLVQLRERSYRNFLAAFDAGRISVTELSEVENELLEANKRRLDQHARYQLTYVSLGLVDGTLLANR